MERLREEISNPRGRPKVDISLWDSFVSGFNSSRTPQRKHNSSIAHSKSKLAEGSAPDGAVQQGAVAADSDVEAQRGSGDGDRLPSTLDEP